MNILLNFNLFLKINMNRIIIHKYIYIFKLNNIIYKYIFILILNVIYIYI